MNAYTYHMYFVEVTFCDDFYLQLWYKNVPFLLLEKQTYSGMFELFMS